MKLIHMKYYKVIADTLNLTKAAERLHVSQPTLTSVIKELEEEFSVTLYYRESRGLRLTKEGSILLEEIEKILDAERHMKDRMHALGTGSKVIRLGISPMLGVLVFPSLLKTFKESYPDISIEVTENGSHINGRLVAEGKLDAAMVSFLPGEERPELLSLPAKDIADFHFCMAVSEAMYQKKQECVTLGEVCEFPLVLLSENSFAGMFLEKCLEERSLFPKIVSRSTQLSMITRLVSEGQAASIVFEGIIPAKDGVRIIPITDLPCVHARLVWNADVSPDGSVLKLISCVRV